MFRIIPVLIKNIKLGKVFFDVGKSLYSNFFMNINIFGHYTRCNLDPKYNKNRNVKNHADFVKKHT